MIASGAENGSTCCFSNSQINQYVVGLDERFFAFVASGTGPEGWEPER